MRRRRKQRATWFPVLGSSYTGESGVANHLTPFRVDVVVNNDNSNPSTGVFIQSFPLIPDFTEEPSEQLGTTGVTLRDYVEGQDYILRRIVGKIHLALTKAPTGAGFPHALVKCGMFIARNIDENQAEIDLNDDETDPLGANNAQDPWIWQRSWMLSNYNSPNSVSVPIAGTGGVPVGGWPTSNAGYGSVLDGPHIDSKVARRVTREHRLWFVVSTQGYDPNATADGVGADQSHVSGLLDVRVLGSMRRHRNQSSF